MIIRKTQKYSYDCSTDFSGVFSYRISFSRSLGITHLPNPQSRLTPPDSTQSGITPQKTPLERGKGATVGPPFLSLPGSPHRRTTVDESDEERRLPRLLSLPPAPRPSRADLPSGCRPRTPRRRGGSTQDVATVPRLSRRRLVTRVDLGPFRRRPPRRRPTLRRPPRRPLPRRLGGFGPLRVGTVRRRWAFPLNDVFTKSSSLRKSIST